MVKSAPCKNCTDRHSGCHSKCKKYADFVQQNNKTKYKKRLANQCYSTHADGIARTTCTSVFRNHRRDK